VQIVYIEINENLTLICKIFTLGTVFIEQITFKHQEMCAFLGPYHNSISTSDFVSHVGTNGNVIINGEFEDT
jgi:hypothetical protein